MGVPESVQKQYDKLVALMERDDLPYVNAADVADLIGKDVRVIRMLAEIGRLPFGFGGRENRSANRVTEIPKLALWNWFFPGSVGGSL